MLEENLNNILKDIEDLSPHPTKVILLAVSKKKSIHEIQKLYSKGHRDFGENYFQELLEKSILANELGMNEIRWHFIGQLQSNKIKPLIKICESIQTLEKIHHLELINNLSKELDKKFKIWIEVNSDEETSKSGLLPKDLLSFYTNLLKFESIQIEGLMSIPDPKLNPELSFKKLIELKNECEELNLHRDPLKLSMGMSSDYKTALKMGSNCIRVGTLIFGNRI